MNIKKTIFILDTTALLYYTRYHGVNITVEKALDEVKRIDEKRLVSGLVEGGLISIENPPRKYINKIRDLAVESGDIKILSDTDIEILALALYYKMKGEEVIVITDDYAIQNILEDLGIRYRPLSRKIKKRIKWIYVCSKCGKHFSTDYHEDVCAYCGGEIVRREKV